MIGVLMVCTGNICRSPMAEGVLRRYVQEMGLSNKIRVDSAGTTDYHQGEAPDRRAQATVLQRGVDISGLQARQVLAADFDTFDYLLAMDQSHVLYLQKLCSDPAQAEKLHLFADFAHNNDEREIDDPYYGGQEGFERVLELVEDASAGLLAHIRRQHRL